MDMKQNRIKPDSSPSLWAGGRERFELPDGRRMSYSLYGAGAGPWVVVLDGPGSRGLAAGAAPAAAELGIRLLAPDRPGFGETDVPPDAGIAEWPRDCAALLGRLGIERFGVLSQSGGTPYALSIAAAMPERVTAVAMLGAIAPTDDPASVAELGGQVRGGIKLARRAPWLLRLALRPMARGARKDPEKLARKVAKNLPPGDAAVVADPRLWEIHVRASEEILRRPDAIAREIGLLAAPWGFDVAGVEVPAALWSGECDEVHPTSQSERLAAELGDAPVHVVPEAANFGLLPRYPDALRFAAGIAAGGG
jgi:pimeloyl-ACP methyl ester carboxylesterase